MTGARISEEVLGLEPRPNSVLWRLEWPEDAGVHSFLLLYMEAEELKTGSESLSPPAFFSLLPGPPIGKTILETC